MESNNIQSLELTKLPIGISVLLSDYPTVRDGLRLEGVRDLMLQGMIYQLTTYILAEELEKRTKEVAFTYSVPKNWWEHLKCSFPDWLKHRFPPKLIQYEVTKQVTFKKYATYPKANVLFPDKVGKLVRYKSFIEEEESGIY